MPSMFWNARRKKHEVNHVNILWMFYCNDGTNYTDYMHVLRGKLIGYSVGYFLRILRSGRPPQLTVKDVCVQFEVY